MLSVDATSNRGLWSGDTPAPVNRYDGILGEVLQDVQLPRKLPAAMLEHIVIDCAGDAARRAEQTQAFVSRPHAGTETIDLLMCAANAGNASVVDTLIQAGAKPRPSQRFSGNKYYKSAMHAAVQYPDFAMITPESGSGSHSPLLPGSKQVRCVEKLLRAGAGMTREQLNLLLAALPTLESPKVARSAWRLLEAHVSLCAGCQRFGCWGVCRQCMMAPYCSAACQRQDRPQHKPTCESSELDEAYLASLSKTQTSSVVRNYQVYRGRQQAEQLACGGRD